MIGDASNGGERRARARRRPSRARVVSFFGFLVVLALIGARKVMAQGTARPVTPRPPPALLASAAPAASAAPVASAAASATPAAEDKPDKKDDKADKKDDDKDESPERLKDTVLGPKGGVPTAPGGRFKSPFASPKAEQVTVRVGVLLESIEEYDIKKGAFTAHFYVSLTSEKPMPKIALHAANGKIDDRVTLADLPTFKLYRMVGSFHSKADLRAYPFDTQLLSIELEDSVNGTDGVRFRPDQEQIHLDANFDVPGWDTAFLRARPLTHTYPTRFDNDDLYYTKLKITLGIRRYANSAIFTVFVPALVIVLISLSGLWFPKDELEVRSNATTPMLAAAVLFHYSLMQELPATAYLSRADKLMMGVYVCLLLHMASSWLWFVLHERHEEAIFRWAKWILVPITAAVMAAGILL